MPMINFLISAGRALSAWRQREQAYAELMTLDDHSLADIGLHRSQIVARFGGVRTPDPFLPTLAPVKRGTCVRRKEA